MGQCRSAVIIVTVTGEECTHISDVNVQHCADVRRKVCYDYGAKPEMTEKAHENGPQWQASDHRLDGDGSSGRTRLKENIKPA